MAERGAPRCRATTESSELERLRQRIDRLDRKLVALLNERARLAIQAGAVKSSGGRRGVRDAERERDVLARVQAANEGPLASEDISAIYRRVIASTTRLQLETRRDAETQSRAPEK